MTSELPRLLVAGPIAALLLGIAAPAGAAPAGTLPAVTPEQRAVEPVEPAVVMVRSDWTVLVTGYVRGRTRSTLVRFDTACSGTVVSGTGHIVTAAHCLTAKDHRNAAIAGAVGDLVDRGVIRSSRRDAVYQDAITGTDRWKVTDPYSSAAPEPDVRVQLGGGPAGDASVSVDARTLDTLSWRQGDVGLLKVERGGLPVASLTGHDAVWAGQPVVTTGYTGGAEGAVSGRISAPAGTGTSGPGRLFYRTSAPVTPELSGGPVVDLAGRVVGIASRRPADKTGFIVPVETVSGLLAWHNVSNRPGPIDTAYAHGLDAFHRGYYTDAVKDFDRVLAAMPAHHPAAEKRRQAVEYRSRYGDPSILSGPYRTRVLLAAGAVLLALLVAVVLVLRRRAAQDPGTPEPPAAEPVRSRPVPAGPRPARMDEPTETIPAQDDDRTAFIPALRDAFARWQQDDRPRSWSGPGDTRATAPILPRCRWCGRTHPPGATYCPSCGRHLTDHYPSDRQSDGAAPSATHGPPA
ncbi:trypsin-like peptidase domain-containing protein [Actinoplanes awajinensis]|uniref:Zinc-ribbon domain-containing protein n=1 Tax=Actinoplanes awajinensis subsp. mycoplanecinus TaxID=135947 RepID=A0A101JKL4_9ACTN|nr:trypsin-like peptidase domain-containing protein [Actinoplanes awajinensis]KUL28472.1 hypothetical protein ADL15_32165 [Actinoplanes awajinensis subsp. mycoplanecinus]